MVIRKPQTVASWKLSLLLMGLGGCGWILGLDEFVDAPIASDAGGGGVSAGGTGGTAATGGGGGAGGAGETASGEAIWARLFGDENAQTAAGVAVDPDGNVIVAGGFTGTMTLGQHTLISAGSHDVFLTKLDPAGQVLWGRRFGGADSQVATGVEVDPFGNILIAGTFDGSMELGGVQYNNETPQEDVFIAKLGSNGDPLWSRHLKGSSLMIPSIAVDHTNGDLILAVSFSGSLEFGSSIVSAGQSDVYIAKLASANGVVLWEHHWGDQLTQRVLSLSTDPSRNIVIGGDFAGMMAIGDVNVINSSPETDVFVARLDAAGNTDWAKAFASVGSAGHDAFAALATDSSGSILMAGQFEGAIDFGCGPLQSSLNGFTIARLSSVGDCSWSKAFLGEGSNFPVDLAIGAAGSLVVTGVMTDALDVEGDVLLSQGSFNTFLFKLSSAGELGWARAFGTTSETWATGVATEPASGSLFFTAYTAGALDLGPIEVSSAGGSIDVLVAKLAL